ncbi:deoxyribodipyrimidine photolyase [Obelidium mucronatum]|nr:deoxyribodipyrimidine photolyase [Obelidium mucronatum]
MKRALQSVAAVSPPPASKKLAASVNASARCVLHWFRSDLRLADNTALSHLLQQKPHLPLVCLFVISPQEWFQHDMAPIKARFILSNLKSLKSRLQDLSIPLIVRVADSRRSVPGVVRNVAVELGVECVSWNWEYEVHEEWRDLKVMDLLEKDNIGHLGTHDQCIIDTSRIRTKEGKPYTVFTPFKKTWILNLQKNSHLIKLNAAPTSNPHPISPELMEIIKSLDDDSNILASSPPVLPPPFAEPPPTVAAFADSTFPATEDAAITRLTTFLDARGKGYKDNRDFPGKDITSKLSPYLSLGVISPRTCLVKALEKNGGKYDSGNEGFVTWISELCWRDFYRNILIEFPRVSKNLPFKLETDAVLWKATPEDPLFQKWCTGNTGFPIVDAGMRQLLAEGWMHNRVRMIVSSFLTKDLGIDWRLGETHFMKNLIDGDLASNNGGWQWSASTGTDSQPYFRIFNPTLQSERFDPDGSYIRKYVPELQGLKGKAIHEPKTRLTPKEWGKLNYPAPIVDHKTASKAFLEVFKKGISKD